MALDGRAPLRPPARGELTRVVYTEDLTRLDGAPKVMTGRLTSRLVFRMSAKYMRRGFDGLLALAEERAGA